MRSPVPLVPPMTSTSRLPMEYLDDNRPGCTTITTMWKFATISALVLVVACDSTKSVLPDGLVAMSPPPRYGLWWSMVESCSGQSRAMSGVSWYVLPSGPLPNGAQGSYYDDTRSIVLSQSGVNKPGVVRHEMLHAILRVPGHPRDQFLGRCDGFVICPVASCGAPTVVSATGPRVDAQTMDTRFTVVPAEPSVSLNGGAMAVIVSITNPRAEDVWIRLAQSRLGEPYYTFGVLFDGDAAVTAENGVVSTGFQYGIAANATRQWVFDQTAISGTLGVRAYFNIDTTARVVFQVKP